MEGGGRGGGWSAVTRGSTLLIESGSKPPNHRFNTPTYSITSSMCRNSPNSMPQNSLPGVVHSTEDCYVEG